MHHILKDHPYRKLALDMRRKCTAANAPRVLGLSASLTYAVTESKVEAALARICDELQVTWCRSSVSSGQHK